MKRICYLCSEVEEKERTLGRCDGDSDELHCYLCHETYCSPTWISASDGK